MDAETLLLALLLGTYRSWANVQTPSGEAWEAVFTHVYGVSPTVHRIRENIAYLYKLAAQA